MECETINYKLAAQMVETICKPTMNELGGLPALLFSFYTIIPFGEKYLHTVEKLLHMPVIFIQTIS